MGALYRKVAEFFRWFFAEPGQLNRAIDEYERLQAIALADLIGRNERTILAALTERKAPVEVEGLVERLRHEAPICLKIAQAVHALRKQLDPAFDEPPPTDNSASATMAAAADTILSLQAKVSRLEGALEPFKVAADMADERMLGRYAEANLPDDTTVIGALNLTLGHLRGARAALTEPPSKYGLGSAGPENNEG